MLYAVLIANDENKSVHNTCFNIFIFICLSSPDIDMTVDILFQGVLELKW